MCEEQYQKCLAWGVENGLKLDSRIERKKINGVYGMYATEDIPGDTVIASYPVEQLMFQKEKRPENVSDDVSAVYLASIELSKGQKSQYFYLLEMFESLEELKEYSFYYFTEAECLWIQKLNPILLRLVIERRYYIDELKEKIKKIDSTLSDDYVVQAALNYCSRSWGGGVAFVPVLDLFNHSYRKGGNISRIDNDSRVAHKTNVAFSKGEQIFISYSCADLASYAINYNYYDSEDFHFIDLAYRSLYLVKTELKKKVFEFVEKNYGGFFSNTNIGLHFRITTQKLFLFENAPSLKVIRYFEHITLLESKLKQEKNSDEASLSAILLVIDSFLMANNVDQIDLKDVPNKLQRFYFLAKKEREMLLANRSWALDCSGVANLVT